MRDYKDIEKDYPPVEPDIFYDGDELDERARIVRDIIHTKLSTADRTIILLYADCGALRKLGERLHCSHMTARNQVIRIRKIILDEYNKMTK